MARTEEINKKMRDETRMKILNGSIKYFARKGLYGTKIKDLSEQLNISLGLIYHYFSSKDELYMEILKELINKRDNCFKEIISENLGPYEMVIAITDAIEKVFRNPNDFLNDGFVIVSRMETEVGMNEFIENWNMEGTSFLANIIAKGQENDDRFIKGDPIKISCTYWAAIMGIAQFSISTVECIDLIEMKNLNNLILKEKKYDCKIG